MGHVDPTTAAAEAAMARLGGSHPVHSGPHYSFPSAPAASSLTLPDGLADTAMSQGLSEHNLLEHAGPAHEQLHAERIAAQGHHSSAESIRSMPEGHHAAASPVEHLEAQPMDLETHGGRENELQNEEVALLASSVPEQREAQSPHPQAHETSATSPQEAAGALPVISDVERPQSSMKAEDDSNSQSSYAEVMNATSASSLQQAAGAPAMTSDTKRPQSTMNPGVDRLSQTQTSRDSEPPSASSSAPMQDAAQQAASERADLSAEGLQEDEDPAAARYRKAESKARDLLREAGGVDGARALATLATILQVRFHMRAPFDTYDGRICQ